MTERGDGEWKVYAPMLAYGKPPEIPVDRYGQLGWIAEVKVDGIRITMRVRNHAVLAWTRPGPGRPAGLPRALPEGAKEAACALPDGVYDAELAVAGGASWDAATKDRDGEKGLFLFDVLEVLGESICRRPWRERRQVLEIAAQCLEGDPHGCVVPVIDATQQRYEQVLDEGGEGIMLKKPSSVYRPGARTREWLKVKPTERATLQIVGYEAAIRGPHATLKLVDPDGNEITVSTPTPILQMADRDERLLLGRPMVVKYQIRTKDGSYRHPRCDSERTFALWK